MLKNTTRVLKEANKYLIMQCILNYEPITTEEIVKKSSISRPTVLEVLKELTEDGYIVKNGYSESTGGRSPALIYVNRDSCYAVGVDFEFPKVRLAVSNIKGDIIQSKEIKFPMNEMPDFIKKRLISEINSLLDGAGITLEKVIGIGLGLSGLIDKSKGKSVHIERIKGWRDVNIQKELEDVFGVPVYINNDVHLLGLVEKKTYMPAERNDFIYIGIRSGIGSSIFYHGKPFGGCNGNAGFIGHTTVDANGPLCFCGNRGCLDVFSGELAMNEQYEKICRSLGTDFEEEKFFTVQQFIEKAKEGDKACMSILKQAGYYLGVAIANMVKTLEIPTVIIGACQGIEGSILFEKVSETVDSLMTQEMKEDFSIYPGQLTEEEYPLGACYYVYEHLFEKPKLSLAIE
ncbi:MAG: ROK family transcriptional regulator [Anaerocolumna sp.]